MKRLLPLWLGLSLGWSALADPYQPKVQHSDTPKPVVLPTVPPPVEITTPSLGLEEVLKLAFQYQTSLKVAEAQVRGAQGRTEQVASALNPRFTLSSTYNDPLLVNSSLGGSFGNFLVPQGFTHSASLQQLLFDFGHSRDLTRSQESLKESAEAAYQQLQVDLVLQIKQAYYSVLQARELVRVQEESLVSRRTHVEQARARFEAGLGLPSDVTRAETALSANLYQLSTAQTNFSTRRLELNQLMGLDPRVAFELRDESEVPLAFQTSEELFERALQSRPELAQYRANLDSAQAALDAAHTQSAPVLGSSLQYQNRQQPSVESISLNLTLSFNAWDGGMQNGKIKEAEAGVDRARAELEAARQRVLGQVGQAYLQLKNAEQQVLSAQAEEANARETQRLAEGRYKVGLGILLDVLDAQAALLLAQANRVNAQTQLQISRAALVRALGETSLSKAGPS